MPRRARIHFVSLRSSLVNLPISIYGPLLERSIRPQNLAVHLTLIPGQGKSIKNEAYVGWTGMASASSLAQFNSANSGESFETIEIDPQYAQGLGFSQGDVVEIGLLHDMHIAKSVGTEPLTSDDWEIIEIHASHVESTLLSQVRVAKIGQEIDVWVLGRTRVRLKVVSLDPQSKNNALLLSTNTEVSIAPKLHSRPQNTPSKSTSKDKPSSSDLQATPSAHTKPKTASNTVSQILRVLPERVLSLPTPSYDGTEILGYVSPRTFSSLFPSIKPDTSTYHKVNYKRLEAPIDPSEPPSAQEAAPQPAPKILNAGEDKPAPPIDDEDVFICSMQGLVDQHVVFSNLPKGVEEWDLVRFTTDYGGVTLRPTFKDADGLITTPFTQSTDFLAGVDEILKRCTDFCTHRLAVHAKKISVCGVSSLLVTGRGGVGKTSIVKTVAKSLQCNPKTYTYTLYVDVSPYSDKPVATVKNLFKYWYEKAWWHKPTILILDNLHELVGTESEHQDSFRTRHITELFLSIYSSAARSASSNSRGILLLATAPSSAALHPLISSAHIFDEVVNLMPPNKDARKDILTKIVNDRFAASKDLQQDPDAPLNFTYLATQTEGYSATDLQDLVSRAVHQMTMRMMTSENRMPLLKLSDFEAAREGFVPLSLRDIKLEKSTTSWEDIGGLHETKRVLRETLEWPTKYGPIFKQSPLRLRSGLLLYGYPGCGKTLLASAVAKECGLNFIGVKGPEILNKYIGASEKTVRDIFERASSAKPCVLFFDEFDSIAPKRGHDSTGVTDRVVNQMLTQMDGAEGLEGVYVLAATSRPDLIDSALLRPGRLDKSLLCNMPDAPERKDILEAVSKKITLSPEVDLQEIADATEGFSGADLQALLYNAHLEVVNESIAASASPEKSTSTDKEVPVQYTTIGTLSKAARSKAEEAALQRRVRQIQAASQPLEKAKETAKAVAPSKKEITQEHIRKVLKTTRPSVSLEERRRLDRIYQAFVSDRDGALPVPPEGNGVGIRATLG
ncbi:AAA-domain-containing protein [Dendrothele bispora CBS 962.96]|uniref:Peroxisomal ATPase PEX1 n=1 Tax=Dendrothele bispora (strain CBS 962.96) TaxID=1314807 RepID=A0A4S8LL35_DENBC|nr:AAA-domain-containing protein [Dendrothele bispora CBS 962.96]